MQTLPYEIGTLVIFKGKGFGVGRIFRYYERDNLYWIEIIGKDSWVRSAPEWFSPIEKEDAELVRVLDGVGLF